MFHLRIVVPPMIVHLVCISIKCIVQTSTICISNLVLWNAIVVHWSVVSESQWLSDYRIIIAVAPYIYKHISFLHKSIYFLLIKSSTIEAWSYSHRAKFVWRTALCVVTVSSDSWSSCCSFLIKNISSGGISASNCMVKGNYSLASSYFLYKVLNNWIVICLHL